MDGDGDDAASGFDDAASTLGSETQQDTDLSNRPFQEILEVFETFLPEAVVKEDTSSKVSSYYLNRLPTAAVQASVRKALTSPLLASTLEVALSQARGPSTSQSATADLPSYPSGLKPGRFHKAKPPPFLKEGIVSGDLPRLPPPVTPADLSFTTSTPGQSIASVPLSHVLSTESTILAAMDLVSLSDISVSALHSALFAPGTAEF